MEVVTKIFGREEYKPPENQVNMIYHHDMTDINKHYCINSKGQFLNLDKNHKCIHILNRSGDIKTFCYIGQNVKALAIDRHDNVFVIKSYKDGGTSYKCAVLFVFDSSGNKQNERALDFHKIDKLVLIDCVVNNDGYIIINIRWHHHIYVCDSNGNLKSRLSLEENSNYSSGDNISLQCVNDQNEIIINTRTHVLVYTKEGRLKRTIKVDRQPRTHALLALLGEGMDDREQAVTYNYATSKIEILVCKLGFFGTEPCYILSYSENDEVERLCLPVTGWKPCVWFCSHPAGPAALIYNDFIPRNIIFM